MYPEKLCRLWVVILFKMSFGELFITLGILEGQYHVKCWMCESSTVTRNKWH